MSELLATQIAATAPVTAGRGGSRVRDGLRRSAMALLGVLVLLLLWELYRALGPQAGVEVGGQRVLPRADPRSMPGVLDVLRAVGEPEVAVPGSRSVGVAVLASAWGTLKMALGGWLLGAVVGIALAVPMQRFRLVERGLLPYVVLSQTVPIIAIAPLISGWGGRLQLTPTLSWQPWMSVVVISAYLAFCPVALGMLRGLQAPTAASAELFTSFAATSRQTLLRLRVPASLPFLVPALRLAAAQAVVGAIVAEISTGTRGGIGRLILQYAQQATSSPGRLYAAIIGAALLGLVAAALVSLLDVVALRPGRSRRPAPRTTPHPTPGGAT
ncbi:ABC transporter permease [Kineococcus rubinsiae]|uniref:ABC transporter permease n=1 Tax=Kineococcus rubinsiae TaxID=2609562 RepID=UPI001AD8D9F5|nr:ABC transporter permease subunit [Kineococcus rubinsiae]